MIKDSTLNIRRKVIVVAPGEDGAELARGQKGHRKDRRSVWSMLIEVSVKHPRAWNSRRGCGWSA